MKTIWKVLLALALVVPMGAYVVGSLAASASDGPEPRETIQIQEPSTEPTPRPTPKPTPKPTEEPPATLTPPTPRSGDDGPEVIVPDYEDFDDHDDEGDDDGEDRGDDDHSGPGGGDDD